MAGLQLENKGHASDVTTGVRKKVPFLKYGLNSASHLTDKK